MADHEDQPTLDHQPPAEPVAEKPPAADSLSPRQLPDPRTAPAARLLGRYLLLRELGRGGMGVVFEAYDPQLDRKVALKLLRPDQAVGARGGARSARLIREAQALARLSHPNVIQVYDAGRVGDRVFLAIELVSGSTLADWLDLRRRPWRQVLDVFLAAGRGLAAAHAAGLVHRDFKPANVLLADDGRPRVLDFGIARPAAGAAARDEEEDAEAPGAPLVPGRNLLDTPITRRGTIVGTIGYLAPELVAQGEADARSDQFSFCVSLHEALYGQQPFAGDTIAALADAAATGRIAPPPSDVAVPLWLRRIVLRGLRAEPSARYPSMAALLDDLAYDRTAAWRRRSLFAGAALAALIVPAVAAYWNRQRTAACSGAERELAGVWDAGVRNAGERAFTATGKAYAQTAWERSAAALDAYAAAWSRMHQEACQATLRGEQSRELLDRRMACLGQRRKELGALARLLTSADAAIVERAVPAASELPGLAACADVAALTATLPPPAGETALRVAELEEELAEARALWAAGRFAPGLARAGEIASAAAAADHPPLLAEALRLRALLEDATGKSEEAEGTLFAALAAASRGGHDALTAQAWSDLTLVAGWRGHRVDEGLRWAEMARAAILRLGGDAELEADLDAHLCLLYLRRGEGDEALERGLSALRTYRQLHGPDHPSVGRTLNRLGNVYYEIGRFPEARHAYEQALEHTRRTLGDEHPTMAVRLGNLAVALDVLGELDEAARLYQRALEIELVALGPDHPNVALSYGNLGVLAARRGRFEEALALHRRALAIHQAALGPDHADTAVSLANVGDALGGLGRHQEALAAHVRALAALEATHGPDDDWTAAARSGSGRDLLALGRPAEALPHLERAVSALATTNADPLALADSRFALARALWETGGDRQRARALARAALEAYAAATVAEAADRAAVAAWLAARGG